MQRTLAPKRERLWPFVAVIALCAAAYVAVHVRSRARAERIVANEDHALALVRRIAAAQRRHHDRTGEYAWLGDLAEAGWLGGVEVETTGEGEATGEGETTGEGEAATHAGYRVEVLLPERRTPQDRIRVGPRSDTRPSRELVGEHFAVVARPLVPGETGYRIWYLDEKDVVLLAEGVSDAPGRERNPLPRFLLTQGRPGDVAGLHWTQLVAPTAPEEDVSR